MSEGPTVSVVTPVYNGEAYLHECIESVLRQTYTSWEYVILDNQSTDGTAAIAMRYAAQDSRIRVVRAGEFLSIYGNHNRALRSIDPRSRYCKVVHADDWLYPECLERMVAVAESCRSVGIVGAFRLVDTRVEHDGLLPPTQKVVLGREVVRRALLNELGPPWVAWVTGSPTSLLVRADLFRGRADFYDESFWHGDTDAAFRALMQTDFGFVHQVLTYTRVHPGALASFSERVTSFLAQEGRLLMRYGPQVLTEPEYRSRMRQWFMQYARFLARERLRRSRAEDHVFHDFHRREIGFMKQEASRDLETRGWLLVCERLVKGPGRSRAPGEGVDGPASPLQASRYAHAASSEPGRGNSGAAKAAGA